MIIYLIAHIKMNVNLALVLICFALLGSIQGYSIPYGRDSDAKSKLTDRFSQHLLEENVAERAKFENHNTESLTKGFEKVLAKRDTDTVLEQYICRLSYGLVVGSSCLIVKADKKNWLDAKKFCEQHNARLAEIRNSQLNYDLMNYIRDITLLKSGESVWLGGSDRDREGHWTWAGSRQAFSYTYWRPPEPNNHHGEDCLLLRYKGSNNFDWNDGKCSDRKGFVCEWSLN